MKRATGRSARSVSYQPPVDRLLTLGPIGSGAKDGGPWREEPFADYASMGISAADAGELVRLARDWALADSEEPTSWGPVHACRALAAVEAVEAVPALIGVLARLDQRNEDWWMEDMQVVLGRLGAAEGEAGSRALEAMRRAYLDAREPWAVRLFVGGALERAARERPERREWVVAVYGALLSLGRFAHGGLLGDAISSLVELGAKEMLPAIRRAFAEADVDEMCCGTLETVEEEITMSRAEREAKWQAKRDENEEQLEQEVESLGAQEVVIRAIEQLAERRMRR